MIWDVALIYTLIWSMQLVSRLLSIEQALESAHLGHRTVRLSAAWRCQYLLGARAGGFSGDLGSLYMYEIIGLNIVAHMLVFGIILGWLVGLPFAAQGPAGAPGRGGARRPSSTPRHGPMRARSAFFELALSLPTPTKIPI